jgi:hypothetical protein
MTARDVLLVSRILRDLRAIDDLARRWPTTDEDRAAIARVRRVCSDIGLAEQGRIAT